MTPLKLPDPPPLVTVTVNGKELQLPKGRNLLQCLLDLGHYVPHYCYQPALSVDGNCRLCLVEIEGRPKPEISCNMVATDGLKIRTDSPLVESCRTGMMEFLLVNHPLDCPICDRGGECMLQRYSVEYGWGTARTTDDRRRFKKPQFDPLIDIERNRCIMCTRCVRFCDEIAEDHVMGVFGHGSRNYIGTFGNGPVSNVFSGNVIDICPVGCLTSKPYRFTARPWELRQTLTTTRTCNGSVTAWTRGDKLFRVTPPVRKRNGQYTIDEDTTEFISNEARFGTMYANSEERLTAPRVRREGRLVECSWETALEAIVGALRGAGPGETCILAGERSTNEEAFLLARLARTILQTPHIDWRSRFISEEAAQAVGLALRAADGDLALLTKRAYGATLMINTGDLYGSAPDIALDLKEAARRGQTRLGLIDARIDPWFARHAETLCPEGPEEISAAVDRLTVAIAAGQAPDGYTTLFDLLSRNKQGLIVLGLDMAGGALNPALVPATLRLLRALGDGWHFLPVSAARNARGVFAAGAQSDRLPTGAITDAAARKAAEDLWGGDPFSDQPGPAAPGLLRMAGEGRFTALLLHRCDELVVHPQRELIQRAIEATPFIAAIDIFPSWITEQASVVLPGALFYETDGSMTDIDGTLQRMSQGRRPTGAAQEDWRIIESLCDLLGAARRYRKAQEIFADLSRVWGAPQPFRLEDLTLRGPGEESPQRAHHYQTTRARPEFKLKGSERPESDIPARSAVQSDANRPRFLWMEHAQGADHLGSRSTVFDALRPTPNVELHPEDAARLSLTEEDWVVLEGGGERPSRVRFNPYLTRGVVYGAANVLGLTLPAEAAGLPAVTLRKTDPPPEVAAPDAEEIHEEVAAH